MKTVDDLIDDVIRREGGFVDYPHDRGGPTKYGITQRTLEERYGRRVTVDEVREMPESTARRIYADRYYKGPRIDELPAIIRPQVFDIAVNSGPVRAIKMLQDAIDAAGFPCDKDGIIGPNTRRQCFAAVELMGEHLINALVTLRELFYFRICARDPSQKVFLQGWLRRAGEFRIDVQS